jgi:hypothetical protein
VKLPAPALRRVVGVAATLLLVLAAAGCRTPRAAAGCYPAEATPNYTRYEALAQQVGAVASAPPGSTVVVSASPAEAAAFVSVEILPLIGLSGYGCEASLTGATLGVVLRSNSGPPVAAVHVETDARDGEGWPRLARLCVGPAAAPAWLTGALGRAGLATLASGELGIRLVAARTFEGRVYLTLRRD